MASKYAKVIDSLPRLAGEEPAYQDKVNAVKLAVLAEMPRHASAFAKRYAEIRREKNALEDQVSELNLQLTAVEQLMVDQYEVEGTTSLKLDTGESVAVQIEPYASVQDKDKFRQWCIAEGLENLMSIPWSTTNSLVKQRLLDGQPEPPGVTAYARSKIVLRKG